MSDFLLENAGARKVIKSLGLPIPLPAKLKREHREPYAERPLDNHAIAYAGAAGDVTSAMALALIRAGAEVHLAGDDLRSTFVDSAEAFGRPIHSLDLAEEGDKLNALVFNATELKSPADLRALYDFYHPLVRRLRPGGRVLVLGRPKSGIKNGDKAAAQGGLEGFVRSLAKEIGKRGATANLLTVEPGAEQHLEGTVRFLLSARAAYISGQVLSLNARLQAATNGERRLQRPLEGKVALVTGAARGIGAATARRLAAEGAHVVCLDRPADDGPLSQIAREVGGSLLATDVTDDAAPAQIRDQLLKEHGGVDIVIHNAGITRDKTLGRMSDDKWDQAIAVNLAAVTRITQALLEGCLRDKGRVICLSSVAGIAGNVGQTNYAASKAGLIGWVGALADSLAEREITINAVAPGFIETRLTAAIPVVIREVGRRLSALGQGGLPEDVAELLTFLSTPAAAGMSGGVIRVCGGAFIGA